MLRRFVNMCLGKGSGPSQPPSDLPNVDRAEVSHLFHEFHGLPHVDWDQADIWAGARERDPARLPAWRRSIAAAWLDELRDALSVDHRRWRHAIVEGLGPLEGNLSHRAARGADAAAVVIRDALRQIRGEQPIPPVALIALARTEDYYSFIARYYPDEGEFGTSGGVYIHEGADSLPMIVMPVELKWAMERTIAHELTHHALKGFNLPLWVEEGLTQMMEERAAGPIEFVVNREMLERHRERWDPREGDGLRGFLDGAAFHSAHDDEQELAYHLAQLVVRGALERRPREFFAFARACRNQSAEDAALEHLRLPLDDLVEEALWPPGFTRD